MISPPRRQEGIEGRRGDDTGRRSQRGAHGQGRSPEAGAHDARILQLEAAAGLGRAVARRLDLVGRLLAGLLPHRLELVRVDDLLALRPAAARHQQQRQAQEEPHLDPAKQRTWSLPARSGRRLFLWCVCKR